MRLFLIPISTRRTLLYCERLTEPLPHQTSLMDKAQNRAAKMWSDWEKKPAGSIQHRIVSYGNAGLRRIAFEEWGLKSVPPLSARKRVEEAAAQAAEEKKDGEKVAADVKVSESKPVEVVYPSSRIPSRSVEALLTRLGTEREALHRKRLIWCFVGMPISAPFGLVPVIPNIPFFYLAYRAWSHWRALSGSKHIQYLLENKSLVYTSSPVLDAIYAKEKTVLGETKDATTQIHAVGSKEEGHSGSSGQEEPERLLLSNPSGSKAIADAFDAPALELELERAIWQVETALEKESAEKNKNQKEAEAATKVETTEPPEEQPAYQSQKAQQLQQAQQPVKKQPPSPSEQRAEPPAPPSNPKDKTN
ncbi:hypothetical protein Sste5346_001196 [Sporothrix stenoceras]|uniref:Mitochondrial K+-H+ exchange-related-domain-containing protein n=1 Tax=Sporothrix stenoceras TaxID=5173 RepID=A0ABR3ZQ65_9PEZI